MKTIDFNGKMIELKEFDFNMVCDLEEMGIPLANIDKLSISFLRAYLSICLGCTPEKAGEELQTYIANGGDFVEFSETVLNVIQNSGFFQALGKSKTAK